MKTALQNPSGSVFPLELSTLRQLPHIPTSPELTGLRCPQGMGKTWVRGGKSQAQSSAKPETFAKPKRNVHVWTRPAGGGRQPEAAQNGNSNTGVGTSKFRDSEGVNNSTAPGQGYKQAEDRASAEDQAAKRRRLAAKGRYIESTSFQPRHAKQADVETQGQGHQGEAPELPQGNDAAAEKREKLQREAEALRKQIAEEEAKVLAAKAAARKREADKIAAERAKQEDRENRKRRLDAGFAEAFKLTRELNASANAPKVDAASNAEVERVLAAKSDLEVMQISAGASTAAIKKRYRTMTLALHPDKCKAEKATDAFQRMLHAYQSLLKLAR